MSSDSEIGFQPEDNTKNTTGGGGDGPAFTSRQSDAAVLLVEDVANFFEELSGISRQLSIALSKYAAAISK